MVLVLGDQSTNVQSGQGQWQEVTVTIAGGRDRDSCCRVVTGAVPGCSDKGHERSRGWHERD